MVKAHIVHDKYLIILFILASMAFFSILYKPIEVHNDMNTQLMKKDIQGWSFVNDVDVNYRVYTALDPNALVFRNYTNGNGRMVNLVLVYHENKRWGAHDPTVCYISQGWEMPEDPIDMKIPYENGILEVKKFIVKKDQVSSLVYYSWFSSDKKITSSRNKQMLDMVLNGLFYGYTESGFLRFSTILDPINEEKSVSDLNDFAVKYTEAFLNNS